MSFTTGTRVMLEPVFMRGGRSRKWRRRRNKLLMRQIREWNAGGAPIGPPLTDYVELDSTYYVGRQDSIPVDASRFSEGAARWWKEGES
ncbi:MAG: hypothetical protein OES13_00385 [Acidimicrobiia bacterium]|nr:hypothetical protein [Acidimicrobiia bacterium]